MFARDMGKDTHSLAIHETYADDQAVIQVLKSPVSLKEKAQEKRTLDLAQQGANMDLATAPLENQRRSRDRNTTNKSSQQNWKTNIKYMLDSHGGLKSNSHLFQET